MQLLESCCQMNNIKFTTLYTQVSTSVMPLTPLISHWFTFFIILLQDCWKVTNCTVYLTSRYSNTTKPTVPPTTTKTPVNVTTPPPYNVVNKPDGSVVNTPLDTSIPIAQTSCGIQIFSGKLDTFTYSSDIMWDTDIFW